jgi:hypothetical protein
MSDLSMLVMVILLAELGLGVAAYVGMRLLHRRKYRGLQSGLSATRGMYEGEKAIKRERLLANLDRLIARCDRLIAQMAGSGPPPQKLALGKAKAHRHRR